MPRRGNPLLVALAACLSLNAPAGADVLTSLAVNRGWIGYSPRNQNPNAGVQATEASMLIDLQQLYDAGWRNLYHYSMAGTGQHIPRLAKQVGFDNVLAGIFYFNEAGLLEEKTNSFLQDQHIDGYIVGNEGIAFGRYTSAQLFDAMNFFATFNKPVTTTEVSGLYFTAPGLLQAGDFVTVNIQPWFNGGLNPFNPASMAQAVRNEYVAIQNLDPNRLVVIKEAWWPTGSEHPAATEANQVAFFQALANQTDINGDPLLFMWGESHDQPWKTGENSPFGSLGPSWGFYESNGSPKQIVSALSSVYTANYPGASIPGDFDEDGDVDTDDFGVFVSSFQDSPEGGPPYAAGDFDEDGDVDTDDFGVFVSSFQAFGPPAVAVPEPSAALLAALTSLAIARRR